MKPLPALPAALIALLLSAAPGYAENSRYASEPWSPQIVREPHRLVNHEVPVEPPSVVAPAPAPPGRPVALPVADSVAQDAAAPAPPGSAGGHSAAAAGNTCGAGNGDCCNDCDPFWVHRNSVFFEFLYMRARDAEVAYAVPIDGPIVPGAPPIQVGRTGVVDPDYEPAFRLGFALALDDCGSLVTTYTHFESNTNDTMSIAPPDVIRSLVMHPASINAATDVLDASAGYGVDFQTLDIDMRRIWFSGDDYAVNYLVGLRYAHLDQDFHSEFSNLGISTVDTNIQFDGGGLRIGLDGEKRTCAGLILFARGAASFVAGDFEASYHQFDAVSFFDVDSSWEAGRVVTMLDFEAGIGWSSYDDRLRLTLSYVMSGWHNVVKVEDYIDRVRTNNFIDLGKDEILSFDGVASRVEWRW
ncbi:MAG: Lpg1974 family pore-forming outer membrane protein [Pirellulales bacterium]